MDFGDDPHLDVCQNIEVRLKIEYEMNPEMTDAKMMIALDNAKIALKKQFGYAKNEKVNDDPAIQGAIQWCLEIGIERIGKINDLTLKEYIARIEKIRRSVERHSPYGKRAYYEFIINYV